MESFQNDVTVIGTGRVGLPLALSLLNKGLSVNGIDTCDHIINCVAKKEMPFHEPGYQEILEARELQIDSDYAKIASSRHIIITVGTPLKKHIEIELSHITAVIDQITPYISKGHVIILRSTVAPQTTEYVKRILERNTGLVVGNAIFLAYCPERIAEGNARVELETLPQIIGCSDQESGNKAKSLFEHLVGDTFITDFISAELSKLFSNISRYIYFAVSNHFMILADEFGANIYEIIEMMNHNYPRQIIAKPGLTAGTCLRKDFGMINEHIPYTDLLLNSWKINEFVPNFIVKHILKRTPIHGKRVALLGYTFKKDSDDTRDSLSPKLMRYVLKQVPKEVRICEPNLPDNFEFDGKIRNQGLEASLTDIDIVIMAINHQYFEDRIELIYSCCRKDTWFADVWNLGITGKIFYKNMEVPS